MTRSPSIMIVDDEPDLLDIFSLWLEMAGYRDITTLSDGEDALPILRSRRFDLLISDVNMPRMDGITLLRELAKSNASVPTILFVSSLLTCDMRELHHLGVKLLIPKITAREDFEAHVMQALAAPENC